MNGLYAAIQLGGPAQFLQRQIGFSAQQFAQFLAVDRDDPGSASATVIPAGNVAGMTALLQELFDHP